MTLQCDVFDVSTSYRDISAFYLEILSTHWRKTRGTSFGSCGSHQNDVVSLGAASSGTLAAELHLFDAQPHVWNKEHYVCLKLLDPWTTWTTGHPGTRQAETRRSRA